MSIPMTSDEGTMAEYFVDILCGCRSLRMGIRWPWAANVVEMCPCSGRKSPQGTLSRVQTQFSIPPPPDFHPEYRLRLKMKSSFWNTKCIISPMQPLTSCNAVVKLDECRSLHNVSTWAGSSLEDSYGSASSTSTFQPGSDSPLLKEHDIDNHDSSATQDSSSGIRLLAPASTASNSCPALSSIAEADDIKHTQGRIVRPSRISRIWTRLTGAKIDEHRDSTVGHSGDGIARRGCLLNSFFTKKRLHG